MRIAPCIIRNLNSEQNFKVQEICIDNDVNKDDGDWMPSHTDDPVIIVYDMGKNGMYLTTEEDNNWKVDIENSTELTYDQFLKLYDK